VIKAEQRASLSSAAWRARWHEDVLAAESKKSSQIPYIYIHFN
jgi:hypothetical protein